MKGVKSLIATATLATLFNWSVAQDKIFNYEIEFFGNKLGEVIYNRTQKDLKIEITKIAPRSYSYSMPNDTTYLEENKTRNLHEKFKYVKQEGSWNLEEYVVLEGEVNDKKKKWEHKPYEKSVFSGIESLEQLFASELNKTNKTIVFGRPYELTVKTTTTANYKLHRGNIKMYEKDKGDRFLLQNEMSAYCVKQDDLYVPKELQVELKILGIVPASANIILISDQGYLTEKK
ncbi:MAG: hypothetical protein ACQESE_03640 [Nanobdellota archaeon]